MGANTLSIAEFARKLKQKYPKYAAAADDKLVVAFCQKFPQYKVNYEGSMPVSVTVVASAATPAPPAADSDKTAPPANDVSTGLNESGEPSPAQSVSSNVATHAPEQVMAATPVAPSTPTPAPPPPVEPKPSSSGGVPAPTVANLQPSPKAREVAATPQTTPHASSVETTPTYANTQEPSGKKGSRAGVIVIGLLIVAGLAGFAAYQRGLIRWKPVPAARHEQAPRQAANADRSSDASGGDVGEYVSGRTTYSDEFVNVESIRIRRSGQGSTLTATVYNKTQSRLNTVIINVSCYSGDGKQVVNSVFTVRNVPPGDRAAQEMTGVLNEVPSRVDIVRVTRY